MILIILTHLLVVLTLTQNQPEAEADSQFDANDQTEASDDIQYS